MKAPGEDDLVKAFIRLVHLINARMDAIVQPALLHAELQIFFINIEIKKLGMPPSFRMLVQKPRPAANLQHSSL